MQPLAAGHRRRGEGHLHLPEIRRLPGRPDLLAEPVITTTATRGTTPPPQMIHDGLEGAVNYSGKFGDVGFAVGAGMTAYQGGTGGTPRGPRATGLSRVASTSAAGSVCLSPTSGQPTTTQADSGLAHRCRRAVRYGRKPVQPRLACMARWTWVNASHTKIMGSYARAIGPGAKVHLNLLWNESENNARRRAEQRPRWYRRRQGGILASNAVFRGRATGAGHSFEGRRESRPSFVRCTQAWTWAGRSKARRSAARHGKAGHLLLRWGTFTSRPRRRLG